jgi:antitoxin component YwqK of YwqJK toxin-antitoxin module
VKVELKEYYSLRKRDMSGETLDPQLYGQLWRHVKREVYDDNGTARYRQHGDSKLYYPNSQLYQVASYKHGVSIELTCWDEEGQQTIHGFYDEKGKRHGEWDELNGTHPTKHTYVHGKY